MCAKTQCCSYDDNFCMFADQECWLLLHVTCTSITSLCNLYLQHRCTSTVRARDRARATVVSPCNPVTQ